LFPKLKLSLHGKHFESTEAVKEKSLMELKATSSSAMNSVLKNG